LKNIQYITTGSGERVAAIVPLNDYRELLESMEKIPTEEQAEHALRRPVSEVLAELIANGKIE
jgi:hypothetical protein